jgi:O-antigen/teichoic acid export membrane protein
MTSNSLALIAAKVASLGLGFAFWVAAARLFPQAEVGIAAGVVAAMMLCTQLMLIGVGSAVIVQLPRNRSRPGPLLDTAFVIVAIASLLGAAAFLVLAAGAFSELDVVSSSALYSVEFLIASVFGTVWILLDQVSTAQRRGDHALIRALMLGVFMFALLGGLAAASGSEGSEVIFAPWAIGTLAVCAVGFVQLKRSLGYRLRARLFKRHARTLVRLGVANHMLTLAERAPGLVLPIVVIELVSPEANAAWYAAWAMATVVYWVPMQFGMTLFAELADEPASMSELVRRGLRHSLAIAATGALVVAAGASQLLSLLGEGYAEAGAQPLRLLLLAFLPMAFVQAYFAVCRATGRLREGIWAGWALALGAIGIAMGAAAGGNLEHVALAWVAAQFGAGVWAAWRLWDLVRGGE